MYRGLNFSWNEMADYRNHCFCQENSYPISFPLKPQRSISGALPAEARYKMPFSWDLVFLPDNTFPLHWVCPIVPHCCIHHFFGSISKDY